MKGIYRRQLQLIFFSPEKWLHFFGVISLVLTSLAAMALPPNDPYFTEQPGVKSAEVQWGLRTIHLTDPEDKDSGWAIETGNSRPVVVAVIDTGIDFYHPDLDENTIWRNDAEIANGLDDDQNGYVDDLIGWNFLDHNNNPWDLAGHGTHVAGIIGAATNNREGIAGINWGVRIMPLKVLSFTGRGRSTSISEAIFYAVANGARIINLSLGGESISKIEKLAVDYASQKGVVVVVAAGNSGLNTDTFGVASFESVITVAAVGKNGQRSAYSNWGSAVDIAAPGEDILSLRARRTDFALVAGQQDYEAGSAFVGPEAKYYLATGTSFAAPFVSGVASLLLAHNDKLTGPDIKRILVQSATDIDVPGIDQFTGYGLLNARAALEAKPEFFIDSAIDRVEIVNVKGKTKVRVIGTIGSDRLGKAWIELGEGENPKAFEKVSKDLSKQVSQGALDDLDVNKFRGAKTWTLRLIVKHKNGQTREARFVLNLG